MPCLVRRGSPAAAFLWAFDSDFGGQGWGETLTRGPRAAMPASAAPADQRGGRVGHSESCPGLAGACPGDKGGRRFWVAFLLKRLCWLRERKEGFAALGRRALPPPVRDGPVGFSTSASRGGGSGIPGSGAGRGIFISPVFIAPSLTVGCGVVSFRFVFLEGRKEEERGAVSLLLTRNQWPSPVGTRALVGMPHGVSKQAGGRHRRQNESPGEFTASLFVFGS